MNHIKHDYKEDCRVVKSRLRGVMTLFAVNNRVYNPRRTSYDRWSQSVKIQKPRCWTVQRT